MRKSIKFLGNSVIKVHLFCEYAEKIEKTDLGFGEDKRK